MNHDYHSGATMVGRDQQLRDLEHAFAQTRQGAGRVVFISGEAGSGKTRLLREFIRRNQTACQAHILEGFCYDEDASVPYAPMIDALRRFVRNEGIEAVRQQAGTWFNELSKILPELADNQSNQQHDTNGQQQKHRLFEAMYQSIRPQNKGTCRIITLEDIHWSDQASQELLRYLARAIDQDPILIICTYRSDELHRRHPLNQLLAHLNREHLHHEIRIPALTVTDIAALAQTMLHRPVPSHLAHSVLQRTEGNAFFVEETLKTLLDESLNADAIHQFSVPETIKASILARIQAVDPATLEVLDYAAVIGRRFNFEILRLLTDSSEAALLQSLQCLINLRLIDEDDDGEGDHYRFHHELIREAIYDDLLGRERKIKHREVLGILEQQATTSNDGLLGLLAYHSIQAREHAKAARYAHQAGNQAMSMYAYNEAIANYESVLEVLDVHDVVTKAEICFNLAEANAMIGNTRISISYWTEAQHAYENLGLLQRVADTHRRIAWALWQRSKREQAFEHAQTAITLLESAAPSRELAMGYSVLSQLHMLNSQPMLSIEYGERAIAMARQIGDESLTSHALNNIGVSLVELGQVAEGIKSLEESLTLAKRTGMVADVIRGYHNLSGQLIVLGEIKRAKQLFIDGLAYGERTGWIMENNLLSKLSVIELETGNWHEAQTLIDRANRRRSDDIDASLLSIHYVQVDLWMRQGNIEQAIKGLEAILAAPIVNEHKASGMFFFLVDLYHTNHQHAEAQRVFDRVMTHPFADDGLCDFACIIASTLRACIEANQPHQVQQLITLLQQKPLKSMNITSQIGVLMLNGTIATYEERWDDAIAALSAGIAKAHEIEFEFYVALMRRMLAVAQLRSGRGTLRDALNALEAVRDVFAQLGAPIELARTEALLNQYRLRREPPQRSNDLTPREQQVLALLARGMSNRAIAEELVISPKTAEIHVSNILSKLSLSSRAQVAAYVADQSTRM